MDTYEENGKEKLETYEWDDGWIEHANDIKTYRVFYIGDSISRGVRSVINKLADGKVRIDNYATSKAVDNPCLVKAVELFASQIKHRDLILFNNGLHGFHLSTAEYEKYYDGIIESLVKDYPNTEVEIVLTTYTNRSPEQAEIVNDRNNSARMIASKYGLKVIDLHKVSYENRHMLIADGIHMTQEGYEVLAKAVLKEVETKLGEKLL